MLEPEREQSREIETAPVDLPKFREALAELSAHHERIVKRMREDFTHSYINIIAASPTTLPKSQYLLTLSLQQTVVAKDHVEGEENQRIAQCFINAHRNHLQRVLNGARTLVGLTQAGELWQYVESAHDQRERRLPNDQAATRAQLDSGLYLTLFNHESVERDVRYLCVVRPEQLRRDFDYLEVLHPQAEMIGFRRPGNVAPVLGCLEAVIQKDEKDVHGQSSLSYVGKLNECSLDVDRSTFPTRWEFFKKNPTAKEICGAGVTVANGMAVLAVPSVVGCALYFGVVSHAMAFSPLIMVLAMILFFVSLEKMSNASSQRARDAEIANRYADAYFQPAFAK